MYKSSTSMFLEIIVLDDGHAIGIISDRVCWRNWWTSQTLVGFLVLYSMHKKNTWSICWQLPLLKISWRNSNVAQVNVSGYIQKDASELLNLRPNIWKLTYIRMLVFSKLMPPPHIKLRKNKNSQKFKKLLNLKPNIWKLTCLWYFQT